MEQRPENQNYDNWCSRQQKNKPQVNSILGPLLFMFISGSHMAWGIATPLIRLQEWHLATDPEQQPIIIISWYIGALIGSVILLFIHQLFSKKIIYLAGGALYGVSSVLMVLFPQNNVVLPLVRLLAGVGHGIVFITTVLHSAENSLNKIRSQVVGSLNVCLLAGMLITVVSLGTTTKNMYSNELQEMNMFLGLMNACLSVLGILVIPFMTRESVVTSLQKGDDDTAINTMSRLRREPTNNEQIQYDIQEIKEMIKEDDQLNMSPLQEGNGRAMFCVVLMRVLYVLGFNYAINMSRVVTVAFLFSDLWAAPIIGIALRTFSASIMTLFVEMIGRKRLFIFSAAVSTVCLVVLAICSIIDGAGTTLPAIAFIIFDVAIGLGVSFLPDVLMSEAFPIKKKTASAMIACIAEYVLQIIIIGSLYTVVISDFEMPVLIASAAIFLVITGGLFVLLPNVPSNSTLREARAVFRSGSSSYNQRFERAVVE